MLKSLFKMKKFLLPICILAFSQIFAQHEEFYATTDAKDALKLKETFPDVQILATKDQHSAIFLTKEAAEFLHHNVLTHGPGYVYKSSKEEAISTINQIKKANKVVAFTINQDALVNSAINLVNAENIKNHIQILQNYGTRRHTTPQAQTSVQDLRTKWQGLITASGRTDISVRTVTHTGTAMPSLVFTINGNTTPTDFVIVGAHMDSISNTAQAPGADDDASGIATITEMIRILLDVNYKPSKTVEFMAFAAEEIGLVGSSEIANNYAATNKNVVSFVQFDMTNFKGSANDVYLTTDTYNSNDLNLFLIELMTHYNATGTHAMTYGQTSCNYGCSDHYSWAQNGYETAFPFEASFSQSNSNIHRSTDTLANMGGNANHAAKFAKLGLEFIIETAKTATLSVNDIAKNDLVVHVENGALNFRSTAALQNVQIIDTSGRKIAEKNNLLSMGKIDLSGFQKGFYLAVFKDKNGKIITKKFIY